MKINHRIHIGIVAEQFGNFDRGGAEVQLDNTINALNKIEGITTEIITSQTRDIDRFDIVHFFQSSFTFYQLVYILIDKQIPYVVSTIIFPKNYLYELLIYKFFRFTPIIKKITFFKFRFLLWENASMLYPNTDKELQFLRKVNVKTPAKIIPNGLRTEEMDTLANEELFYKNYPFLKGQKFILNVARIDPRKNQEQLVIACKELDLPLVIIGNNLHKESFERIKKINYNKLYYLGAIYDKQILYGAYKACSVYCLPSTMETPGISAMEAAYFDKPVVITKFGGTEYYFKDKAFYVDWRSVENIKDGILQMIQKDKVSTKELMEQYSWDKIADLYVEEYKKILYSE
jgi:glycosyltransferase involved in cell wall biosynthesis